jgi:signal transduction histidine kinase
VRTLPRRDDRQRDLILYGDAAGWARIDNDGMDVRAWSAGLRPARLAAPVGAVFLAAGGLQEARLGGHQVLGLDGLAVLVATLPLALAGRLPVPAAFAAVAGAVATVVVTDDVLVAPGLAALAGLFLLTRHGSARARWLRVAAAVALLALPVGGYSDQAGLAALVGALGIVAAIAVGDASRTRLEMRRGRMAALVRRIDQEREQARLAERGRIARELHDVVAHSVSVIAVQAELSPYGVKDLSPAARERFDEIARSARAAMAELRRLLDVLRGDEGEDTDLAPQPGLADLEELLAQHRAAGGRVVLRMTGAARLLDAAVELSAYRIVQEALTNTRRHAPGATATVELGFTTNLLTIRVDDDGPGPAQAAAGTGGTGHGLVGMRERVALLGGVLRAGPGRDGGFEVVAVLPAPPAAGADARGQAGRSMAGEAGPGVAGGDAARLAEREAT